MNGSEPQRDAPRPDEKSPTPSLPPGLVFKPDVRQAVRVARVRMYTLMAAAVLMVVALVLIISYRPPVVRPVQIAPAGAAPPVESASPTTPPTAAQPPAVQRIPNDVEIARSAVASIDTLVRAAGEKWLRATELSAQATVTRDNAQEAAEGLRKAVILTDSARQDVQSARQQADLVGEASREAGSGSAFRLSVLYSAMDRYLKSMDDDAADRRAYYEKSEASVKAVLLGDSADSETQQNVATSYLRKSEDRQPSIKRLAEQMREAERNIENAGR